MYVEITILEILLLTTTFRLDVHLWLFGFLSAIQNSIKQKKIRLKFTKKTVVMRFVFGFLPFKSFCHVSENKHQSIAVATPLRRCFDYLSQCLGSNVCLSVCQSVRPSVHGCRGPFTSTTLWRTRIIKSCQCGFFIAANLIFRHYLQLISNLL